MPSFKLGRTTEDIHRELSAILRALGRRLSLRHVPQLIFKATDSIEYGTHISKLLHDLEPEGEPSQEAASQEEEE